MVQREPSGVPQQVLTVAAAEAGRRIESFLDRRLARSTWGGVQKMLRQGRVAVDGRPAVRGEILVAGQIVAVAAGSSASGRPQPNRRIRLRVVHEDADLVVVVKPARLTVHPGPGHGTDTLLNALVALYPEMADLGPERGHGLVHRLDRETSGLLVAARTATARDRLVEGFAARTVDKVYLALVAGAPAEPAGEIDAAIDGQPARTVYRVLATAGRASRIECRPITGRTHQIRIHLAGLGCPVLADRRHGRGLDDATAVARLTRMALHAAALTFDHPATGRRLSFEEREPRDLRRAWKRLGEA